MKSKKINCYARKFEDSPVILVKYYAYFHMDKYDIHNIWKMIIIPELRYKWDKFIKEINVIEKCDENGDVIYS